MPKPHVLTSTHANLRLPMMTTIILSRQQLELCKPFQMKKEDGEVLSMAIKFCIEIEKAATKGCFKIIWPMIRRTPRTYSVGGLCTFNSLLLKLSS